MAPDGLTMTIDGTAVRGSATFSVEDPATGKVLAVAPDATSAQLDDAFRAAARALPGWAADADGRESALNAAADAVVAAADELTELVTSEQGKPLAEARAEVLGTVAALRHFAGVRLEPMVLQDGPEARVVVRRRPVGVVAAITPWNAPLLVAGGMKIAPALAAGNTVVLKPSPFTPLATLRLGEVLRPVLPAGVVNVLSGGATDLGRWMTSHPVPRLITFTGSPRTGRLVAESAARDLKRTVLELGGNDPAIVLDDAVVSDVAEALFWGAFGNAGQTCVAVKRVYVPESLRDELVAALAAIADTVVVGDGHDPATRMGPLTYDAQRSIVGELVTDAVRRGGRVAAGGAPIEGPGYFYRPTILDSVADGFRIVDEEQFGPALPVVAYRDVEQVLATVNASEYGLGSSVWSADPARGRVVADRIEAGTTWVNTHKNVLWPVQPIAGVKQSGLGAELGAWGMESFTELSVQHDVGGPSARPVGVVPVAK
ncbi:aldehyde dehydrogenase family protein [Streptosporangium sp. NBC_01755]|uniref:aldehyde dehydrogenase family protein n=1 Tax=unclassified Streptosporangium TaxID=2632669 RepID=UPI002DDBFEFA|nr:MULTISPECIES: aldehyde dehydrogenase family protein [unclassified Streptosporangium]WSA24618.1 aldehyde dehydrogenase family protein [Streptosporangium sp. NBC_01810]WSC97306.1 aldehyde dehydrogenase family protein [Streptosporangium sp. NBC_01755]